MPFVCTSLSREIVSKFNQDINALPVGNILRKESLDGEITVTVHNEHAVYHSAAGFYFHRIIETLEQTIQNDIHTPRDYLCAAFELDPNDSSVKARLLNRFQEQYGQKLFQKIDYIDFNNKGKILLLVKFPSSIVRQMLAPSGGILRTVFSGPTQSLLQIPTLVKLANIDTTKDFTKSVFITEYKQGMLPFVLKLHYDIVSEVINKPNGGITIGPVGLWDA